MPDIEQIQYDIAAIMVRVGQLKVDAVTERIMIIEAKRLLDTAASILHYVETV